ncbi:MAG: putative dehydrogenase [Pedosphaera sp.]|nr:putative dehydrogenase [Pedosphaera sp.]
MQKKKSNLPLSSAGLNRRNFIRRTTLAAGAAAMYFPYVGRVLGANDRINIGCIGVGGKGDQDSHDAAVNGGTIVAICDVDKRILAAKKEQFDRNFPGKFTDMKQFQDYRELLDKVGKDIDAVTVSTPDHHHGVAAIRAMKMGKHAFCQKPLVQTVYEARAVRALAKEKNLATQMGNQGSAEDGLRRAVEVIQAGIIGNPLELHVWSNRPIWPQGVDRPMGDDPVPENLDWDIWLGPAKQRPYKNQYDASVLKNCPTFAGPHVYHQANWRGWMDFGTGALGDMACHTVNMPFRGCKLGYPNVVELEIASRYYSESYPKTARIRYEFPERDGLPPMKFWWYDGNPRDPVLGPLRPPIDAVREIINTIEKLPGSGALIIGEKGKLYSDDDYGTRFFLCMKGEDTYKPGNQHEAAKAVPQTLDRIGGGTTRHMKEWFDMMKTGKPAYSNFEIAGYLAEVILLGCVALRAGEGKRMEWDGPNMKSPNLPEVAQFVKRENRAGWEA